MDLLNTAGDGDYAQYEALILQKEQFEKDAEFYYLDYLQQFGELIAQAFELKVECIALKKEISLYIAAKNRGKTITQAEINDYLQSHMSVYYDELNRIIQEKEFAKNTTNISSFSVVQIKTIYRKIAKILHPDISTLTEQYPVLAELFNRVIIAYKCNNLKEMQKLEVLVNKELEENGIDKFLMVIPDLTQRIEELESDIDEIIGSEPYIYKNFLEDEDAVEQKKKEIEKEILEYKEYKEELTEKLKKMKEEN